MPRVTTAYVSQYQRSRVHQSDFVRGEQTTFHAQFNGALDEGVLIDEVTWFTGTPWAVILSDPLIATDRRSVSVDVTIGWASLGNLKCVVVLNNGQVRNQLYRVTILDNEFVDGEAQPGQGPMSVTTVFESMTVSVEPDSLETTENRGQGVIEVQIFDATVTGGTPPYTYQWSLDNEVPSGTLTLGDQQGSEITLFADTQDPAGNYSAELLLTVTDSEDSEVEATPVPVSVTLVNA